MVDVPRPPPTAERQKEYDRNHAVGMILNPNPERGMGEYEPMFPEFVEWCEKSLRWKNKRTKRYVNPHRATGHPVQHKRP